MALQQCLRRRDLSKILQKQGYATVVLLPSKLGFGQVYHSRKFQEEVQSHLWSIENFLLLLGPNLELPQDQKTHALVSNVRAEHHPRVVKFENLGLVAATLTRREISRLDEIEAHIDSVLPLPDLELISPQESAALAGPPGGVSWGIRRLGIESIWDQGITGRGVIVGHLDTGVDGSHASLEGAVEMFVEVGIDASLRDGLPTRDSASHGTHTAGLISGRKFGDFSFGCAPESKLASAIVIEGGNVALRVIRGADWCLANGVRIINLSVGVRGYNDAFRAVMQVLRTRNVLPVVAVGNEGPNSSRSPGNYAEALSVGAVDEEDKLWPMSSFQSFKREQDPLVPDVVAPGAEIWSSWPNQGMMCLSGTSMAGPHVSGLAALLLQSRPDATALEIEAAILQSSASPNSDLSSRTSHGLPDAVKAMALLNNVNA